MAYEPQSIRVLKGLAGVQARPSMYIGSVDADGLHHLIWEVLDNAVDEAVAGYCRKVTLRVDVDEDVARVEDDGRGIPPGIHPTEGISTIDVVMTMLHAGGKFDHDGYKVSGGLHGVGASVVNALSEWMEVRVFRDGVAYSRRYEEATPTQEALGEEPCDERKTGTTVEFKPSRSYFKGARWERARVSRRLRELSFLNEGVAFRLEWLEDGESSVETFVASGGLTEYAEYLAGDNRLMHEVVRFGGDVEGCEVDMAFAYDDGYDSRVHSFCNNISTKEGGVHQNAALDGLCKVVAELAEQHSLMKDVNLSVNKGDVSEGLSLVVSVLVPDPEFGGQTKTKLGNKDLRGPFGDFILGELRRRLLKGGAGKAIATKIVDAVRARDAARKARSISRKKSLMASAGLPGKLSDCASRNPEECELFLVEGDSAAGTSKDARDRHVQAILPLRGKVLNVNKATLNRALENKEIKAIISALGVTVGKRDVDLDGLRYHKVILMADADPDGGHICCLLLTFFHTCMRRLIEEGHLYVCDLPLYAAKWLGKTHYLKDDAALKDFKDEHAGHRVEVSRFKGLGEMSVEELEETAMAPGTRSLKQVSIGDDVESYRTIDALMGSSVQRRKDFLAKELNFSE